MQLTMPQIVLMNHAAHYNGELMRARIDSDKPSRSINYEDAYIPDANPRTGWFDSHAAKQIVKDDPLVMGNKRLSDVSDDFELLARYLSDWSV